MTNERARNPSATTVESITDPESLRDRDDVRFTEETAVLDRETYESVRGQSEVGDGAALVGITNDDGEVLLKDTCTGWLPPGGNVAPDGDWAAVARQQAESWTGVAVELDAIERVRRIDRRLEGADPSETPALPFHVVYFRASPAAGEAVAGDSAPDGSDDSASGESDDSASDDGDGPDENDEDAPEVQWFGEVPEGVDQNHEDDVGVFFG